MKKWIVSLLILGAFVVTQASFADDVSDTAKIKIRVTGTAQQNNYFLCLNGVGCLSILAAAQGKVYPVFHAIQMDNIYVADVQRNFRVSPQGLPDSCNVSVKENQTITISGRLVDRPNGTTTINNLQCSVA